MHCLPLKLQRDSQPSQDDTVSWLCDAAMQDNNVATDVTIKKRKKREGVRRKRRLKSTFLLVLKIKSQTGEAPINWLVIRIG